MSAKLKLRNDVLLAVLGFGLMYVFAHLGTFHQSDLIYCFLCSGVIFGWRIASHVIVAVGIYSFAIKLAIAVLIGFVAMPITLIYDLILVCKGE